MVATDIIAGTMGGVAVVLIGHPFDTTKTRLQTAPPLFYANTFDCVRKTIQWEGALGFYTGMCSPLLGQMFFRATSFSTYYYTTKFLQQSKQTTATATALTHGSSSSDVTKIVLNKKELFACGGLTGLMISFIEVSVLLF